MLRRPHDDGGGFGVVARAAGEPVITSGALDEHTLRHALLAVISETAQHLGHADIIREQIDGQTGR